MEVISAGVKETALLYPDKTSLSLRESVQAKKEMAQWKYAE
jgi:hypothetical protein